MPLLFPTVFGHTDSPQEEHHVSADVAYTISCALLLIAVLALFFWIVDFISTRIMLSISDAFTSVWTIPAVIAVAAK